MALVPESLELLLFVCRRFLEEVVEELIAVESRDGIIGELRKALNFMQIFFWFWIWRLRKARAVVDRHESTVGKLAVHAVERF